MRKLLFLCGPSGVGKSTIGRAFAKINDWLLLEADISENQSPGARPDQMALLGIRDEWNEFWDHSRASSLLAALKAKGEKERKVGAILSLPGLVYFEEDKLKTIQGDAESVILFASAGQCLDSFLEREKRTGRNLSIEYWAHHNAAIFRRLEDPKYSPQIVPTFDNTQKRRGEAEICADIERRLRA